jgi:predicted phage terminase large subunit-like protein
MNQKDRQSLRVWEDYRNGVLKSTTIDINETYADKEKRIELLKGDFEKFCKYYFPTYCMSEFSDFHRRFAKKVIKNKRIYITRKWARAHAKSVVAGIMLPLYLKFTGELKNMLCVSYNESNAQELLLPLMIQFESNQRIINDFGDQAGFGNWETGRFTTKDGCSFRAIGSGQSPRGARNNEARPDYILCDDIDEDELCRNKRRLDQAWDWMQGALLGCFDIKGAGRFVVVGNIIAPDSLVKRSCEVSDDHEQIDILCKRTDKLDTVLLKQYQQELAQCGNDKAKANILIQVIEYVKGGLQPSWVERFSIYDVAYMVTKMGFRNAQREYFNNPLVEGKVFKKDWMQFKKLPPLKSYRFLVNYLDPGFKKTATSDSKAMVLVGLHNGEYHIHKVFCGQASIEEMIEWGYAIDDFVKLHNGAYQFKMEEVFLQSLLYEHFAAAGRTKNRNLPVSGDTRKKPDKDARIEGLSGYFERGLVFFSEDILNDHHCKTLIQQFTNFEPGVKTFKDGPDATEGAFFILNNSVIHNADVSIGKRHENTKRA